MGFQYLPEPSGPLYPLPFILVTHSRDYSLIQKAWTQTWHQMGFCLFIFLSYKSCALVLSVGRCTVRQVSVCVGGLYYSATLGGMEQVSRLKGQPNVVFACPSLGQTIPTGKG